LLDPCVSAHATFETFEISVNPCLFIRRPSGDLIEVIKAKRVTHLFHLRPDTFDLLEIIRHATARTVKRCGFRAFIFALKDTITIII